MTNSTFYHDGYRDAVSNLKFDPPGPYEFGGKVTYVQDIEYRQGFKDAKDYMARFFPVTLNTLGE